MDSITSALAATQAMTQNQIGLAAMKMAIESERQMAALLSQVAQSGAALASNPAHLGQSLDTYA